MAKKYKEKDKYKVGDEINHGYWSDTGIVSEVGQTPTGTNFIIVDFKRVGTKKLVHNTELKKTDLVL